MNKPKLNAGETYAGAIINPDDTGNHIILLTGDKENINWQDAMTWAKELGGDLPTRAELILLYENHAAKFKELTYWSNTQHASYSSCAWGQSFDNGYQGCHNKNTELRSRAVRRVEVTLDLRQDKE